MKSLADIITEAQALATIGEDQFEAALAVLVTDLQAFVVPSSDPVVSATVTTQSGIVTNLVVAA